MGEGKGRKGGVGEAKRFRIELEGEDEAELSGFYLGKQNSDRRQGNPLRRVGIYIGVAGNRECT